MNNAGISRWATFPEADADNLERTLDVHLRGTWHTTRAAWPYMEAQGYGRIITTTSTGMLGLADNLAYATAKGALIGFTRSLAVAAAPKGILVNCDRPERDHPAERVGDEAEHRHGGAHGRRPRPGHADRPRLADGRLPRA